MTAVITTPIPTGTIQIAVPASAEQLVPFRTRVPTDVAAPDF
jgi:hypothetical protein